MSSFSALKKRKNNLADLKSKIEKQAGSSNKSYNDDRYWVLERDQADNGYAVIRFLDVGQKDLDHYEDDAEVTPWVHYYEHGFKHTNGRWFSAVCPTSLGNGTPCPVCEANQELWGTGTKENQDTVRKRKRKENYVSNILVIKDPKNPANEGKVFLYRYGPKIFEMITDVMTPEFEDEEGFNPFDFWEGANFTLKAREQGGYINYDKSSFGSQEPLFDTDKEMESVWKSCYALHEIMDQDKKIEPYDKIKDRFEKVVGVAPAATQPAENVPFEESETPKASSPDVDVDDDEDEDLDYFRQKLDED